VTATGAVVAGTICLLDRHQLHKALDFHVPTFRLHYPLIRSFVAVALLASTVGLVAACASLRGATRIWATAIWVATLALLIVGIQHSPAHYAFSQPRSGLFFASGQRNIFPFPQMRRFAEAAVLTFLAGGLALVAAWLAHRDQVVGSD